jgi:hypothetical protein
LLGRAISEFEPFSPLQEQTVNFALAEKSSSRPSPDVESDAVPLTPKARPLAGPPPLPAVAQEQRPLARRNERGKRGTAGVLLAATSQERASDLPGAKPPQPGPDIAVNCNVKPGQRVAVDRQGQAAYGRAQAAHVIANVWRVSVPPLRDAASVCAYSLAKLGWGPDDKRLVFSPAEKGSVLRLEPMMQSVTRFSFDAARATPSLRDAAFQAREMCTFAIAVERDGRLSFDMASALSTRPEDLLRVLHSATGDGCLQFDRLARDTDVLLPHLRQAYELQHKHVATEAAINAERGEAAARSPASIDVRARTLLHIDILARSLEKGGAPLPAHETTRMAVRNMLVTAGAVEPDAKPRPSDFQSRSTLPAGLP